VSNLKRNKSLNFTKEDKIDFDPVRVKSVRKENSNLVINMPSQPCYSQRVELKKGVDRIPRYEIDFVIYNGEITQNSLKPPFKSVDWEVKSPVELRACFLPVNYIVDGPVILTFEFEGKIFRVVGSKFELKVVKRKRNSLAHAITK
jgi:hypothetical protein